MVGNGTRLHFPVPGMSHVRAVDRTNPDLMLVSDESITTTIDIRAFVDAKWGAINRHATQMSPEMPFIAIGLDAWRETWATEAYILRDSRDVDVRLPETDLFAGLS